MDLKDRGLTAVAATALVVAIGASGVMAQASESAAVTGTVVSQVQVRDDSDLMVDDDRIQRYSASLTWQASDPRLGRVVTYQSNVLPVPDSTVGQVVTTSWTAADETGVWFGQSSGFGGPGIGGTELLELSGHGTYAGLEAVLLIDWDAVPPAFEGAIVDGQLPPAP